MAKIDEQKFLQLYDHYIAKVYRYIYFRVGSEEVAQDLSSEAFSRAWEYLKMGKNIGNFSAMIYQICRNLIADYFRKNHQVPISIDEVAEKELIDHNPDLIVKTSQNLEIEQLKNSLKYLREEYQEMIIWRYIEDFSVNEIAQITEKTVGSVRTSLSRAIKALKEIVERDSRKPPKMGATLNYEIAEFASPPSDEEGK